MLKRRLIPTLFLKDGLMVRSESFEIHQVIGHPVTHVERMTQWDVDELIVIDISRNPDSYEIFREDQKFSGANDLLEFISNIAETCAMPLAFGGTIRTVDDVRRRIMNGADKVVVNTMVAESPDAVTQSAHIFGSQAIVVSVDYRGTGDDACVFTNSGKVAQQATPEEWARRAEAMGAGEVFLNAIDRDGKARGFDIETIERVSQAVRIPVIACGGAGHAGHFTACFKETQASGVAAGNIFHFTENAYPNIKRLLRSTRDDIR